MTILIFEKKSMLFEAIAVLFRRAVGAVTPLRNSLLGKAPSVISDNPDALKEHLAVRKFKDEDGLIVFVDYLRELVDSTVWPHPVIESTAEMPIKYTLASGKAWIGIQKTTTGYLVIGSAGFENPDIAKKILESEGFETKVTS